MKDLPFCNAARVRAHAYRPSWANCFFAKKNAYWADTTGCLRGLPDRYLEVRVTASHSTLNERSNISECARMLSPGGSKYKFKFPIAFIPNMDVRISVLSRDSAPGVPFLQGCSRGDKLRQACTRRIAFGWPVQIFRQLIRIAFGPARSRAKDIWDLDFFNFAGQNIGRFAQLTGNC
jgi:hypothetical protein